MLAFDAMNAFLEAEQVDLFRIVHGEQKFAYERPVVPGDVLTATLTVASLRQIGGNDIIGTTSEITDAAGALVCTAGHPRPPRSGGRHEPSTPSARRTFTVTRADLVAYAEASGDHNPIHQDEEVARSVGLPGRDRARHVHHGAGRRAPSPTGPAAPRWSTSAASSPAPSSYRPRAASRSSSAAP